MHISCGNNPEEIAPLRKYDDEKTTCIGSTECGPSLFSMRVTWIFKNEQGRVKEYLLALPVPDIMLDQVLIEITSIPLESNKVEKFISHLAVWYIIAIYMSRSKTGGQKGHRKEDKQGQVAGGG
jgi:hypothetical protein